MIVDNHMILDDSGNVDYAGTLGDEIDDSVCPECGGKLIDGTCENIEDIYHENI